ncbi:MAG: hypothetical protein HQM02_07230 [Magnetococcales bacterium]|nr:hypothetical protein [Magnetococcales bacterium]
MEEPIPADVARRATAWLMLGLASLTLSTLCALLLAAARMPGWSAALAGLEGVFHTALVLHVNLSATVWFLAFSGALWSLAGGTRLGWVDGMGFFCALSGTVLLMLAPLLAPGRPVLSDYLPTLRNPFFFAGLLFLGAGMALAAVRALCTIPCRGRAGSLGVSGSGLFLGAVSLLMALLGFVVALVRLPGELTGKDYFDPLYWAGGHWLQFNHVLMMLTLWLVLARVGGIRLPFGERGVEGLLWLGFAPALLGLYPLVAYAPETLESRRFFTNLMVWGSWLAVPFFVGGLVWGRLRGGATQTPTAAPLWGSVLLFALGVGTGSLIENDSVMVTAHYHGTVGAVTLACMGMVLVLLPALGYAGGVFPLARLQAFLYVSGLSVLILGLAWSGMRGAPRKTPLMAHAPDVVRAPEGMALMGAGAAIALVATFFFLLPALRTPLGRRKPAGRWTVVLGASAFIGLTGGAIHLLPEVWRAPPEQPAPAVDAELARRFQEGAMMLHAKRYEYAITAFHWVLQRAPEMPEAHVNMGFALLGLERFVAARDFFQAALALRPEQVNAYYGLAQALDALQDREGARGAMRTFVHLNKEDSPFARKARAALWEWEKKSVP